MERYGKKLIQTWLPPHGRTITRPSCPPSWRRCLSIGDFARERAEMAPLTSRWPAIRRSAMSASLIGHLRSSTFRLSTTAVSMSLTGSRFSSESAPRPFHYGIRGRGGTIFGSALPLHQRQVQADIRTHLIHRPAKDIFPRLGGTRVFSYCN